MSDLVVWPGAPRYGPDETFPPYRHVPGRTPHPVRDPDGHAHGAPEEPVRPLPPERWREDAAFLRGVDLYHAGYLWEAHEAWEGIWRAAPPGPQRELLRGLIQLAAELLKAQLGNARGVRLLSAAVRGRLASIPGSRFMGLDLDALRRDVDACFGADGGGRGPAPRLSLPRPPR